MPKQGNTATKGQHTEAYGVGYEPRVPEDWDGRPHNEQDAHDLTAGGHAGVALISDTEPTAPATGQIWLDTLATGTPGLGVLSFLTITASITLTASVISILADATNGPIVVTVHTAAGNSGRLHSVKKIDPTENTVTINPDGAETIDKGSTVVITLEDEEISFFSDNSNWQIIF